MKKTFTFFKKISLLLVLFCLLDYSSGLVLKLLFYKQKSGKYYTTTYAMEHARESIMIFGSSHANEHFNALLMEAKLKKSTFNFGNQGQSLLYQYPIIKTILQKNNPQLVIISLDYYALNYMMEDYQRLSIFLPFRGYNQYVDSAIINIDKYELYKSYSSLYRYNSTLGYIFLNTFKSTYNKSFESRGFDPTPGTLCNRVGEFKKNIINATQDINDFKVDCLKIRYLTNIIDELQTKKIKTVFVLTPHFDAPYIQNDLYFIELKKILAAKGATFWDFSQDSAFVTKCELFNDFTHLNEAGANLFTEHIIEKIKLMLQE